MSTPGSDAAPASNGAYNNAQLLLEVAELLSEAKPDYKIFKPVELLLKNIQNVLRSMPEQKVEATDATDWIGPLRNDNASHVSFTFKPPTHFKLVGSYTLRTIALPHANIDMIFQIPSECISGKDVRNHRYHDKRALYLGLVGAALVAAQEDLQSRLARSLPEAEIELAATRLQPPDVRRLAVVLRVLHPSLRWGDRVLTIRLLPSIASDLFPAVRLHPLRNNCTCLGFESEAALATPHYNASVLADAAAFHALHLMHTILKDQQEVSDAAVLLKLWHNRRNGHVSADGFNGFLLAVLLAFLVQTGIIPPHLSALQIVRAWFEWVSSSSAPLAPIVLQGKGATEAPPADLLEAHRSAAELIVLMPVGSEHWLNLAAHVSASAWLELQANARVASHLLNTAADAVERVWLQPVSTVGRFDAFVRLRSLPPARQTADATASELDWGSWTCATRVRLAALLRRGLGDRAVFLRSLGDPTAEWPLSAAPTEEAPPVFGLRLDQTKALRALDTGPAADEPAAAAEFRAFWGDKAELRRFKDGRIVEAVLWEEPDVYAGALGGAGPLSRIVSHIFARHASLLPAAVQCVHEPLSFALSHHGRALVPTSGAALIVFDKLARQIRGMKDLPLTIRTIQPASASMRYTEPLPVVPLQPNALKGGAGPLVLRPLDAVLVFDASGQWPDDVHAIRALKAAFYLRMSKAVAAQLRVGGCQASATGLDVLEGGFVFRFHIYHERELTLLQADSALARDAHRLQKLCQLGPLHHMALAGLHGLHPVFAPTARLLQRWMHSHLLSPHVSPRAAELIAAAVFTDLGAYSAPAATAVSGLSRALQLITQHDWQTAPLVVNFASTMQQVDHNAIQQGFASQSSSDGGMFIATAYDHQSVWTRFKPSRVVLQRLVALARVAHAQLENALSLSISDSDLDRQMRVIFTPNLADYDVKIQLESSAVPALAPRRLKNLNSASSATPIVDSSQVLVGFRPAEQFVKELKRALSRVALVFYNRLEGMLVTLVWRPAAFTPRSASSIDIHSLALSTAVVQEGGKVVLVPNVAQIVELIRSLGKGLVTSVELVRQPAVTA